MSNWSTGTNTIQEVDTNKNLTLQMLKLRKQGGGTEYFVRKSDVTLGTKSVTQNGTYTAASDGKYGFSQFKVNVKGGNGSAGSDGKPTYTPPSGSTPASGVEPGDSGSAVVGKDPTTGNDAVVGVDSNGNLVTTPLPSSIVLVTNPTKMDYNDGESIDLSGAVVVAKMADGTTWTDVDHPNGHVSCSCDPAAADISQASTGGGTVPADNPFNIKKFKYTQSTGFKFNNIIYPFDGASPVYTCSANTSTTGNTNFLIMASKSTFSDNWGRPAETSTIDGKTVHIHAMTNSLGIPNVVSGLTKNYMSPPHTVYIAWLMVYGGYGTAAGTQTITLNWARPGDGKVLSTTMEITVGAHTTESSSGTEGS